MGAWHRIVLWIALAAVPGLAIADTWVATRTLPAKTILAESDLARVGAENDTASAYPALDDVLGLEVRVTIYAGRPVRPEMLGPPAIIERNDIVRLNYHRAGLAITTEGRALGRAAVGEHLRVLNLGSRTTVTGIVRVDRSVSVTPD